MPDFEVSNLELAFWEALALIVAACIFAPLFRRLGLGTILGYLVAGIAVQLTLSLSYSDHPEELLHFAEFGVVLFLFVIGLELNPRHLWDMRGDIFGLGLAQMAACGILLAAVSLAFSLPPAVAILVGFGLALSSTALVMQSLDERRERTTTHGRKSFAILLFQDLAIVPLLLLVAILAPVGDTMSWSDMAAKLAVAVAAIAGLVLAGLYLLDPAFRLLAQARMPEIMTASALGVVIAAGLLMDLAGMSYALGAFLAGVMLAESSYRHEIEANIEPFRGLFLGLFFLAVGLSLDLTAVAENWLTILVATPVAMALKAVAIYTVGRLNGSEHTTALKMGLGLSQFGEFGFVLFAAAATAGVLDAPTAATLIAIVTVSMALAPLVGVLEPMLAGQSQADIPDLQESFEDAGGVALIIGFGRFGQIVAQPLFAENKTVTILDANPDRVREAERFGFRVHYGDGTRRDVLRAAGAADAEIIVVCVDRRDVANHIVALTAAEFPDSKLLVRSIDRVHSIELARQKVAFVVRETFESALRMGKFALINLGTDEARASEVTEDIRTRDRERLSQQIAGDITSGRDRLYGTGSKVRPEPLTQED